VLRTAQAVKTGAADYEMFTADGASGSFEVTLYHRFEPGELDAMGLPRSSVPGGTMWVEEEGPNASSIYFLSSGGVGLGIANRTTAGAAAPADSLGSMAQRLAPLVAGIGS
jgi:hypothetical protein